jgi:hypothetical protein
MTINRWSSLPLALTILALICVPLHASKTIHITGGGQGTFGADLDGDGDIDGSHFGIGVDVLGGGIAEGHFTCLMAGNKDFLGLHLMLVEGQVDAGTANPATGSGWFSGSGSLHINGDRQDVTFVVTILQQGGPGDGKFQLTVFDTSGGVVAAFPPETVESGGISIH